MRVSATLGGVIVVIGCPSYRPPEGANPDGVGGSAASVAFAAAAAGARVQLVGRIGDDAVGDALVLALGRSGVGHAALLRDPGHPTPILVAPAAEIAEDDTVADLPPGAALAGTILEEELASATAATAGDVVLPENQKERPRLAPADLELALRYLPDIAVIVAADPLDEPSARVVADGAAYAGAQVIATVPPGTRVPDALVAATVLEAPPSDPDGAFARLVGGFAAALDGGASPAEAFRAAASRVGWESAST